MQASSSASFGHGLLVADVSAAPIPKRPGGGLKWSEVCERVQKQDGSVRTSPLFNSGATATSTASPPRPRPAGLGLGKFDSLGKMTSGVAGVVPSLASGVAPSSSRGGSSRGGSSGKSSRSSSKDPHARDGDISSRCSSGHGWDTSTASSGSSRPRTPENFAPSPSGCNGLMMPDPIRTSLVFPPSLLDGDPMANDGGKGDPGGDMTTSVSGSTTDNDGNAQQLLELQQLVGGDCHAARTPFKWDPCGRDGPRLVDAKVTNKWTVEPLAKYLETVLAQVETNVQNSCLPTAEKLDSFVLRLVANTHRQIRHAPKAARHILQNRFARSFSRFWDFTRNKRLRSTNPEELCVALTSALEALTSEPVETQDALSTAQPQLVRNH